MAKYDSYTINVHAGGTENYVDLKLTVLLEVGDNVTTVITDARNLIKAEAVALKASAFVKSIEQK